MNAWDNVKIYEGVTTIRLNAPTVTGMIAECREQLDAWIATFDRPPQKQDVCQTLRMVSFQPLKYELYLRPRVGIEARTIL